MIGSAGIGIYDWGIGGLGTFELLQEQVPQLPITYFSDAGFKPYGKVKPQELRNRVFKVLNFYQQSLGISKVLIACNAASSILSASELKLYPNILKSGLQLVEKLPHQHVGIIGGTATIQSHQFQSLCNTKEVPFTAISAQVLSAHIEAGLPDAESLLRDIDAICTQLEQCDSIVMACTHYPVLLHAFQKRLPTVEWIDPAAKLVLDFLAQHHYQKVHPTPAPKFITTGDPIRMQKAIRKVYNLEIGPVATVNF